MRAAGCKRTSGSPSPGAPLPLLTGCSALPGDVQALEVVLALTSVVMSLGVYPIQLTEGGHDSLS